MKKLLYLLFFSISIFCILYPAQAEPRDDPWRMMANKMQAGLESGSLGRDFRLSFNNHPFGRYNEEELMAYTLRGDGTVIIQMHDKLKVFKVLPAELFWLCKVLLEYDLANLPQDEQKASNSASFAIVLRNGSSASGVRFYNSQNDRKREIIWQYLFRFGQLLLTKAGLRQIGEPVLPVCKGITSVQEIDSDNDGLIDWLRLDVSFYSFTSGEFIIDFSGYTEDIFFAQGNSTKEFFLNAYFVQGNWKDTKGFLKMGIDSKAAANATGPYIMDIGLGSYPFANKNNFRPTPNLVFKGAAAGKFSMHLKQTAVLEIKKGELPSERAFGWFCLAEILPDGTELLARQSSRFTLGKEDYTLASWDCLSADLHLSQSQTESAIFEVGWNIPDKNALQRRIDNFRETMASASYRGNTESIKSSLESHEKCRSELEKIGDLEVKINYCQPPLEKAIIKR
jgi:hypothetical protein